MVLVSMANCACATTFGYDILVPFNPSVVAESRQYITTRAERVAIPRVTIGEGPIVLVDYISTGVDSVEIRGSWNGWGAGFQLERLSSTYFAVEIQMPADSAFEYKFVVNGGEWLNDPMRPMTD